MRRDLPVQAAVDLEGGLPRTPFEADCFKGLAECFDKRYQFLRVCFFRSFVGDLPPRLHGPMISPNHDVLWEGVGSGSIPGRRLMNCRHSLIQKSQAGAARRRSGSEPAGLIPQAARASTNLSHSEVSTM